MSCWTLQTSNNIGLLNTCTRLWLTESEQASPVDSIKDVIRSSGKVPEFDKRLKKVGGHIGRNVVEIAIKTKTIVRKPLMIKRLYYFLCSIFKVNSLFSLILYAAMNEFFWFTLLRYVSSQPINVTCWAVFTS